jgi:RimJ/RimL family protein N-acetyltransferase
MAGHLQSIRLVLRPFEERDIETFARYRSDPEVARYQGWEAPYGLDQAAAFVADMLMRRPGEIGLWCQMALENKGSGEMLGDCAFQILEDDPRQAEIGLTVARAYQGKGYGTEAAACLLGYLFDDLDLHRVRANIDPRNGASARVLERVGMRHEGTFVESLWFKGYWADEDWYAILQNEWKARMHSASS